MACQPSLSLGPLIWGEYPVSLGYVSGLSAERRAPSA